MRSPHDYSSRFARASVIVAGLAATAVLSACSGGSSKLDPSAVGSSATAKATTTTKAPSARCPLTDLPAPGGTVPQRQALAVKIDNLPDSDARPQYGIGQADVVYEEPVEGGITRYIAIFQCNSPARVESVRSGRIIDPEIIEQYGEHPLMAYSGGIQPAVDAIDSSSLIDVSDDHATSAYWRDPDRVSPHNLAVDTEQLWAAGASLGAPAKAPKAVFRFGKVDSLGTPAASVEIPWTYPGSAATWTWDASTSDWLRSYPSSGPAYLAEGGQISATNVIVMSVVMYPSQYVEDGTGTHENLLTLTGSGSAEVFTSGEEVVGTWQRSSLSDVTRYLDSKGRPIDLAPGNTWIELVPTTITPSVTP